MYRPKLYGAQICDHCKKEFVADYDTTFLGGNAWQCPYCEFDNMAGAGIAGVDRARQQFVEEMFPDIRNRSDCGVI